MFSEAEEQRVVRAIANAERDNRGEVRVHVERRCPDKNDPVERAYELYRELGLRRTRDDTGVLLYIASRSKRAAVYGGAGIYGQAQDGFWQSVTDAVATGYREQKPVDGICQALHQIGELLREHAAGEDEAGDEVPNAITVGRIDASAPDPGTKQHS